VPVTASFYAPGVQYEPADFMNRDADWIVPGVLSSADLQVTAQSPAALAVNVAVGSVWLAQGYRLTNDATLALAIVTADATNPRIDVIVTGINTAGNPYTPEIKVITGTAAATPVVPTTPAGYLLLAQVSVAAGATSIAQASITDERVIASLKVTASQIGAVPESSVGATNGVAGLDVNKKVLSTNIPAATATVIGGVKAGAGISVATDGTISTALASAKNDLVTGITAQTVFTFTPTVSGMYSVKAYLRVVASATNITLTTAYADSGGAQSYTPAALNNQSITVGSHGVIAYDFEAVAGTAITLTVTAGTANQVYVTGALTEVA